MLNKLEKQVIAAIQENIPVCQRPYKELAQKIGVSEHGFLEALNSLHSKGLVRRFGATIRHQISGFSANAMVAWQVDEDRVDLVGETFAGFAGVSHCYRRNPTNTWPYNLYTMIHAQTKQECRSMAADMAKSAQAENFSLLFSIRELKKTSMVYFS